MDVHERLDSDRFLIDVEGAYEERSDRAARKPSIMLKRGVSTRKNDRFFEFFEDGQPQIDCFPNIGSVGKGEGVLVSAYSSPSRVRV